MGGLTFLLYCCMLLTGVSFSCMRVWLCRAAGCSLRGVGHSARPKSPVRDVCGVKLRGLAAAVNDILHGAISANPVREISARPRIRREHRRAVVREHQSETLA